MVRQERMGVARRCKAGEVVFGDVMTSEARQVRYGAVRSCKVRQGGAGVVLSSEVMRGQAWQVSQGQDW